MNPEQILAHLKRLGATLTPKQIASLVAVFVAVVGVVVGSAYWMNTTSYSLLFSDMDPESMATVVNKLKTDKVPYTIDNGGRSVRVAAERVDELRLGFASQGTPLGGRIGFEIFDRTAFGTTEFLEHVNYRRALEGELARTISTIAEVSSARVHIAMAKDSLFSGDAQPAKASVVLKLRNNRPPSAAIVNGIAGLVSASVESLRPESVVIVDTFGRSLAKPANEAEDLNAGLPLEHERRLEKELSAKVVALLEPVVGTGRVRVNVTAALNTESREETEERWDPTTVLRSKQTSSDSGSSMSALATVAGARANLPPSASAPASTPAPSLAPNTASRSSATENYEVSKLTRHTVSPRGQLTRLSVAVILDDERVAGKDDKGQPTTAVKPRSTEEMQRIQKLVSTSVGLDADRGDQITVENIAFGDTALDDVAPAAPVWWERIVPPTSRENLITSGLELVRLGSILGLAVLAFFAVLRPMMRRALQPPQATLLPTPALAGAPPRTVADLESDIEAELDAGLTKTESRRLPVLTRRISKTAEAEPEHIAKLVRSWMSEEER